MRIQIEAALIEFEEKGNTLWVHNSDGCTVLRIKCAGFDVERECENYSAHADISIKERIAICIPEKGKGKVRA